MLEIECSGTPFEIGYKHGKEASVQVNRSIIFYAGLFHQTAKLSWEQVQKTALEFEPIIKQKWPAYLEEMRGIAAGSGKQLSDIIALNVRTEINFGLFSDGCTALSWKQGDASFLAQNWDWMPAQKENLLLLTIHLPSSSTTTNPPLILKTMTEAGILAKIGLNSLGVGVCLNAIRAKGLDKSRIPCHLGLRMVLESASREEAVRRLKEEGVASACHMLIADATGGVGLEWSYTDLVPIPQNAAGQIFHSNHYILPHAPGVLDSDWLPDSRFRLQRVEQLCNQLLLDNDTLCLRSLQNIFTDEKNYPHSICRAEQKGEGGNESETLFNIVMDLGNREGPRAKVILGRPTAPEGFYELSF